MGKKTWLPLYVVQFFFLFLLTVVESTPILLNITVGSTLSSSSPNQTAFWLSPSENFAFGFYKTHPNKEEYTVGIWLAKSCHKTLVWELDRSQPLLSATTSSVLFDQDGLFKLQVTGNKNRGLENYTRNLFGNMVKTPASYAAMQDDGNFVIYDSKSRIIWQSFDYPTDTILAGQTLKSGYSLIASSSMYRFVGHVHYSLIMQEDQNILVYDIHDDGGCDGLCRRFVWGSQKNRNSGHAQLKLDSCGNLNVVDWSSSLINNLYKEKKENCSSLPHRVTLDSDGSFRLYKDYTMGCDGGSSSVVLWRSRSVQSFYNMLIQVLYTIFMASIAVLLVSILILRITCILHIRHQRVNQGIVQHVEMQAL
ncbi:hypothetical protein ACHQM5_021945 [Ranunculus cassubicifolius]